MVSNNVDNGCSELMALIIKDVFPMTNYVQIFVSDIYV